MPGGLPQRVDALEAQVAVLEAQVATHESQILCLGALANEFNRRTMELAERHESNDLRWTDLMLWIRRFFTSVLR